jgi:3-deoxy-D-manno-octulosonate 8-phosphate phosphatase (KDO 8-P phosphatase)
MNVLDYFKPITTFVFDVDGVLTDGTVLLLDNGVQARRMHTKDGLALQMALRNGYHVVIISGAYSDPVLKRLQYLGITDIYLAIKNKKEFLSKYLEEKKIALEQVLFMGDDLPDLEVLQYVGLSCCPADAVAEVKKISTYIATLGGGHGCVREVIERVLKLNNKWNYNTEITSR